jgi:hypothetical protein
LEVGVVFYTHALASLRAVVEAVVGMVAAWRVAG